LERPFFWSKTKIVEYIGDEIGAALLEVIRALTLVHHSESMSFHG
jgi:hypothetical protein